MQKKKHIPRKNTDINNLRGILLNINDHIDTTHLDYKVAEDTFKCYLKSLVEVGVVAVIDGRDGSTTNGYTIKDVEKFEQWRKSIYKSIKKNVIPFLHAIVEVASMAMVNG